MSKKEDLIKNEEIDKSLEKEATAEAETGDKSAVTTEASDTTDSTEETESSAPTAPTTSTEKTESSASTLTTDSTEAVEVPAPDTLSTTKVSEKDEQNTDFNTSTKKDKKASKKNKAAFSDTPKEKKEINIKDIKKLRVNIGEGYQKLQSNVPVLIITCAIAFIAMIGVCCAVFFANVKGPEQVLVPNVIGESLEDALLEMQVKELYPKINLRYSNDPSDKGTILEQDPEAGTIVKGYSRVSLVVSRGVVVDSVGDYVGKNLSDVQMSLQTLFAGQLEPLIILGTPKYIPDTSEPGTILEQDPPEGFRISSPVTVQLVVSRGPNYENTRRPYVIGQNVNDLLQTIARSKIVFDITSHTAGEDEKPGTVTSQEKIEDEFVPNYTRVAIEMAMPENSSSDENIFGIFRETLTAYPYPIAMRLEAIPAEGNAYTILNFTHPGGNLTIPYAVPRGTTLVLYVADKVRAKQIIE